jgi:hypothetical protein
MKTLALVLFSTLSGIVLGALIASNMKPTFTRVEGGWKYQHVPLPACPDNQMHTTVDGPDDSFTVRCEAN